MPTGAGPPYRVVYSEVVQENLRALARKAKRHGLASPFASVLKALDHRLRSEPFAVGEPLHFLADAGLYVRKGGNEFFYFVFGVDEIRRIVYMNRCDGSARLEP